MDSAYRLLLAAISLVTMFHPNDALVKWTAAAALPLLIFGVWRHAKIAAPTGALIRGAEARGEMSGDLDQLVAEARREV